MREAIEVPYRAALGLALVEVPAGITPLSWFVSIDEMAEQASPEEFRDRYANPAGAQLARDGVAYGAQAFASLRVEDRPAVRVMNASGVRRSRDREFIVHALGWSTKGARP
jgi:hypothetical protein